MRFLQLIGAAILTMATAATATTTTKASHTIPAHAEHMHAALVHAITHSQARTVQHILRSKSRHQLDINRVFGPHQELTYVILAIHTAQQLARPHDLFDAHESRLQEIMRILRMLKKAGADLALRVLNGRTALHIAVQANNRVNMFLIVDQLIDWHNKQNHSFDTQDNFGRTALHYAAQGSDVRVVDRLIDLGATIDMQDGKGATPLHFAGGSGTGATTQALVCHGANKNIVDQSGATPMDWALGRADSDEKSRVIAALKNDTC